MSDWLSAHNPEATSLTGKLGAQRLEPDMVTKERFANLLQGFEEGLKTSKTVLDPLPPEKRDFPKTLDQRIIKDITSLENGFAKILNMQDNNATHHYKLSKDEDLAPTGQILFDYANFSTRYYLATNYASGAGNTTAEDMQVFTKSR